MSAKRAYASPLAVSCADVLCEFLEAVTHHILYIRRLYPQGVCACPYPS